MNAGSMRQHVVKKAKGSRRASAARDARFAREGLGAQLYATRGRQAGTSVCKDLSLQAHLYAISKGYEIHPHLPKILVRVLEEQAAREPVTQPQKKEPRPWFASKPTCSPIDWKVPAPWRDLSDEARPDYYLAAMRRLGPVHGFTLNLHPDNEALALKQPATASWLRDRIAVELRAALGRSVPLFFGLEQTGRGRLHVHGVLGIAAHEAERARKALRRAGGEWDENRQFQAETKADPDHGWTAYVVKEFFLARPFVRQMMDHANDNHRRRRFNGAVLVASNEVRSLAGKIYEEARNQFMQEKGITRSRSRAKKARRWPTNVRAMLASTMMSPLTMTTVFLPRSISSVAAPGALLPVSRALGAGGCPRHSRGGPGATLREEAGTDRCPARRSLPADPECGAGGLAGLERRLVTQRAPPATFPRSRAILPAQGRGGRW
ncbi:hypothetical protein ACIKTA_02130 [Hansschlegelia beijingensis]